MSVKSNLHNGTTKNANSYLPQIEVEEEKEEQKLPPSPRRSTEEEAPSSSSSTRGPSCHLPHFHRHFERFTVYETSSCLFLVGSDRYYSAFRLLILDRTIEHPNTLSDILKEDRAVKNWEEMEATLQMIDKDAKLRGEKSLRRVLVAVALVGFIRFHAGYYISFVTSRRKIGCLGGNFIYGIASTQLVQVSKAKGSSTLQWMNSWLNANAEDEAEARYLGLFHFIDLTKDFYFSYSYDLTNSLQSNITSSGKQPPQDMYVSKLFFYINFEMTFFFL